MTFNNEISRLRREVIARVVRAIVQNTPETIDRIPIQMRPKGMKPSRCCIYKDRAALRYRTMTALGFRIEDEVDELKTLASYAEEAKTRQRPTENFITIFPDACSACMESQTVVTNLCRGCLARPCEANCPKKAITIIDGRARIDRTKCVDCGICAKACSFHAIVQMSLACSDACPVNAVSKTDDGRVLIDNEKCTHCGRCIQACPFGAIMQCNQVLDVLYRLQAGRPVVAMVAPSVMAIFPDEPRKLYGALKKIGFSAVYEVAHGADETAQREAAELAERRAAGDPFMTTSCCPAFVEAVHRHMPELLPFVSHTRSPMAYTHERVKRDMPNAITVFIGPCAAKRTEAVTRDAADYVLTAEELGAIFMGMGVQIDDCEPTEPATTGSGKAIGFGVSGGVAAAVVAYSAKPPTTHTINGLNEKTIRLLKIFAKNKKAPADIIEVMACEGGCCSGPCSFADSLQASARLKKLAEEAG